MAKGKSKYVSFAAQREQCRLNKFTYTEKCSCGIVSLMCNYTFDDPKHKKGMCRASTCTDMRKTLADDVEEILSEEAPPTEDAVKDEGAPVQSVVGAEEAPREELAGELTPGHHGLDDIHASEADPKGAVRAE